MGIVGEAGGLSIAPDCKMIHRFPCELLKACMQAQEHGNLAGVA
jgi:hypothetical protein